MTVIPFNQFKATVYKTDLNTGIPAGYVCRKLIHKPITYHEKSLTTSGTVTGDRICSNIKCTKYLPRQWCCRYRNCHSLPDYALLDRILFQYIELRKDPGEIVEKGFDQALVNRILKMVNTSEHKRQQAPPVLRVSPKAFGSGRRLPIVAKYLS